MKNNLEKLKEKIAETLKMKEAEIEKIKKENQELQKKIEEKKMQEIYFVTNSEKIKFPEFPKFPEEMKISGDISGAVDIRNFETLVEKITKTKPQWYEPSKDIKFPEKIKIDWENKPSDKLEKPLWIEEFINLILNKLKKILNELWKYPILTERTAEDRLKPQAVIQIDPETGKPIGKPTIIVQGGGFGGGGVKEIIGLKDSNNNRINPAREDGNLSIIATKVTDTLSNYFLADKDDDASPNYYGFVDKDGNWYILKETISAGNDTYRYAKGTTDYVANWANRANLTYDYFFNVF